MQNYDEVFKASFARAVGTGSYNEEFIRRFYEIFMSQSEEVAGLFTRTNMASQKTMLHDSLHLMAEFFFERRVTPQLERLAFVHSRAAVDIRPELYELWLSALSETVAEFDPEYSREIDLAWRLVLSPGVAFMQYFYDRPLLAK